MKAILDNVIQTCDEPKPKFENHALASEKPTTAHLSVQPNARCNTQHNAQNPDDRYLTSIQLNVLTIDRHLDYFGHSNSQNFLDWLQSMDMYFIRYLFSEAESHVRYHVIDWTS